MTQESRFKNIPSLVLDRNDPEKHAEVDRDLVLKELEKDEFSPILFYGIAHILKHYARNLASELEGKPESGTFSKGQKELRHRLVKVIGWADEFFWLGIWSHTGKLDGPPDFARFNNPDDLFFQILIQFEWADLIGHALLLCEYWDISEFLAENVDNVSEDRFLIWTSREQPKLNYTLRERAIKRFVSTEEALRTFDEKFEYDQVFKESFFHAMRSFYIAKALIESDEDTIKLLLHKARNHAQGREKELKWISQLEDAIKRGEWPVSIITEDTRGPYESVTILAEWIEDLLYDELSGTLHPRSNLQNRNGKSSQYIEFPNLDTIKKLRRMLREQLGWLQFVTRKNNEYHDVVENIEKKNEEWTKKVYEYATTSSTSDDCWNLYSLRDWGSYTPLFPVDFRKGEGREIPGGGGGYFLHYGDIGIVIDPGFDYIEHFYAAGLSPNLITHVIVTHDHYDHAASFGPLLNLLYKYQREDEQEAQKKISFYLSRGVLDQYARSIVDFEYYDQLMPITDHDTTRSRLHFLKGLDDKEIQLIATHTEHANHNGFGQGVGLLFALSGLPKIGITSDTGWYDAYELNDIQQPSLGGVFKLHSPDVMVLHVGSLKRKELKNSGFYKTHLGARGVLRCIETIDSCRLALLSEFGEECSGYRKWFAHEIQEYFKSERDNFRCFPTDRMTVVTGKVNGELLIGRNDEISKSIPYEIAKVQKEKAPDGTFMFENS